MAWTDQRSQNQESVHVLVNVRKKSKTVKRNRLHTIHQRPDHVVLCYNIHLTIWLSLRTHAL